MNKSYRTIWNEALGAWVAVSEIENRQGKSSGRSEVLMGSGSLKTWRTYFSLTVLAAAILLGFSPQVHAADAVCVVPGTSTANGDTSAAGDQVACGQGAVASAAGGIAIGASTVFAGAT